MNSLIDTIQKVERTKVLYKDIIKTVTTATEIEAILNSRKAAHKNNKPKQYML